MSKSIPVSEKHGLNPSQVMCIFCDQPKAIAMLGRLPNDAEAPRQIFMDYDPCDNCQKDMDKGITFIGTTTEKQGNIPPIGKNDEGADLWPTGAWSVVTEDFVKNAIQFPHNEQILLAKKAFVPIEFLLELEKYTKGGE